MNDITVIQNKIYEIRGLRVMLDFDLAPLYQVQTKVLKQAVRRNIERFPADFMFEITIDEYNSLKDSLRSQIVTSNKGGTRYMPFAFTEQGVSMLSSVLRSDAAIQVNIAVMRAFVAMRNYITTTTTLTAELAEIRAKLALLERNDEDNAEAINDLSEDMRKELDNIYQAIAALSIKTPQEIRVNRAMTQKQAIQLFEERKVRTVWDDEAGKWYVSVIDVVGVLTDSADPNNYWKVLKSRLKKEGNETVTNCNRLKMLAADGKMRLTVSQTPLNRAISNEISPDILIYSE